MAVTLTTTKAQALIPALTSSLAQLQPAMAQTQESIQGLVSKVTDALASSEERGRKLEAALITQEAQHAVEKAAYEQRFKAQEALIDTMQKTMKAMQKRLIVLEGQTKYIRPAIRAMIASGGSTFLELGYPGKKEDLELRKPDLEKEIALQKEALLNVGGGIGRPRKLGEIQTRLVPLEAEAARIAAFEAREGKA